MRFPVRIALVSLVACCGGFVGCERNSSVRTTIPDENENDVDPRTVVAIRISNTFSDADMDNTDPNNWSVTGDLSNEEYTGTITFAEWGVEVFPGQTIDEYEGSPTPVDPSIEQPVEDGEPIPVVVDFNRDTLVFELDDGQSFKEGETISVFVKHDITARGTPVDHNESFVFRVRSSDRTSEGLFVESSDPVPGQTLVDQKPRLEVRFNRGVDADDLADIFHVRGSQSGAHVQTELAVTETDPDGGALEVAVRLAADDSFLPGEDAVLAVEPIAREAPQEDGSSTVVLDPYTVAFQIAGGEVRGDWSLTQLTEAVSAARAVVVSNVDRELAGSEVLLVTRTEIVHLRPVEDRVWESTATPLASELTDDGRFEPVAALPFDLNLDGVQELLVLLAAGDASRLQVYEWSDEVNRMTRDGDPVEIATGGALGLTRVDLDANGEPELVMTFDGEGVAPQLYALALTDPDPDAIDVTDPDSLLPRLTFVLVEEGLPALAEGRRVEAADLNSDGRLDLISETSVGLELFENVGTSRTAFAVRSVRTITGRAAEDGTGATIATWTVSDLDQDGDQEILLWESGSVDALLYDVAGGLLTEVEPSFALLSLGVVPQTVLARDLDGSGRPDLAAVDGDGTVTLLLSVGTGGLAFEPQVPVAGGGAPLMLAAGDLDADSGMDVVSIAGERVRFLLAEDVLVPDPESSTIFRIAQDLTTRDEETLEVVVVGDFAETFTGYNLALDYDEELLTYDGFDAPEDLDSLATFTPCPDATGAGCAGGAAVTMAYDRSRGAAIAGVVLGTFRFTLPEVTESVTTTIELTSFSADETTFANTVEESDGEASVTVPVILEDASLQVALDPPAPPDLAAECSVSSRGDASLDGEILWTSPAGLTFDGFEVLVGGQLETTLPGTASSYQFTTDLISEVPIRVRGLDASGAELASDECVVVGIHRPTVECSQVTPMQNRVSWTLHAVDRFEVLRNGEQIATLGGTTSQFFDDLESTAGSNVYEVIGFINDVAGPTGSCDAVGDPNTGETLSPEITSARLQDRDSSDAPNTLQFLWTNGEGYERIVVEVERLDTGSTVLSEELAGTATEFVFAGDPETGGVPPREYRFAMMAFSGGVPSDAVTSGVLEVPVPVLSGNFLCSVSPEGDVTAIWDRVWQGYTGLVLRVEQRIDGQLSGAPMEIELDLDDTSFTLAGLAPIGTYSLSLVAAYDVAVPPSLVPEGGDLTRTCTLSFEPTLRLPEIVEGGAGAPRIEFPVVGDIEGTIEGFQYTLEVPSYLLFDPDNALETPFVGGSQTLEIVEDGDVQRLTVTVTGIQSPPDLVGGERSLATVVASAPEDFELPPESPVRFVDLATVEFPSLGSTRVNTSDSTLRMYRRFVTLERATIDAGSDEAVDLMVRGTLNEPAPDYRLLAFTIHVAWDPEEVELLPISQADQDGTAGAGLGTFILPNGAVIDAANEAGDLAVPWFGLDFSNVGDLGFIEPGFDQPLLLLRFRSRLGADAGTRFLPIRFLIEDADRNPTAFVPEIDIPGQPNLEGALDGGIQLLGSESEEPISLDALTPSRGSLLGGGEATVTGAGFPADPSGLNVEFLVPGPGGSTEVLPAQAINEATPGSVRFVVPDSGLRELDATTVVAALRVSSGAQSAILENAYRYEPPSLVDVSPTSGSAAGGETVTLSGAGFPPTTAVRFRVGADSADATVLSVSEDGTEVQIRTPDLREHAGDLATIDVVVPEVGTISRVAAFSLLGDEPSVPLELTGVEPDVGSICGGEEVTLLGSGFAANARVFFGDDEAVGVVFLGMDRLRVTTPAVPEGTADVGVRVSLGPTDSVTLPQGFAYQPAGPQFIRGDVDENELLSVADAVLLSDLIFGRSTDFPAAADASDANDDGVIDQDDISAILSVISGESPALPAPFPGLGFDPTPDTLISCDG